jgi:hypothetical protein
MVGRKLRFEQSIFLTAGLLFGQTAAQAFTVPRTPWASPTTQVTCAPEGSRCAAEIIPRAAPEPAAEANHGSDLAGCRGLCNPFGQIPEFVAAAGMPPGAIKPPAPRPAAPLMPTAFLP